MAERFVFTLHTPEGEEITVPKWESHESRAMGFLDDFNLIMEDTGYWLEWVDPADDLLNEIESVRKTVSLPNRLTEKRSGSEIN